MQQLTGISNSKCVCVMLVVIGCFAVLWPKIFYPMFMCALNRGRNGPKFSFEKTIEEQTLPQKVREAMKLSPIKQYENVQKLPGRPQFYAGRRDGFGPMGGGNEKGPSSNSMLNFMIPVYTIVIGMLFLYIMAKMSFKSEDNNNKKSAGIKSHLSNNKSMPSSTMSSSNRGYRYEDYQRQNTTAKQRARDPNLSRSSYKAFNYYGRSNVSKSLRGLIQDMETFRTQLVKTEICHCKLKKYELARKATENCLNEMVDKKEDEKAENDIETSPILDETAKEPLDNLEISDLNNQTCLETNEISENVELTEDSDNGTSDNEEENKENIIPGENQESNSTKLKQRRRKSKNKPKLENEITEESIIKEDDTEESIQNKFNNAFDTNVLNKLNQELDRLMHLKEE